MVVSGYPVLSPKLGVSTTLARSRWLLNAGYSRGVSACSPACLAEGKESASTCLRSDCSFALLPKMEQPAHNNISVTTVNRHIRRPILANSLCALLTCVGSLCGRSF